MIQKVVRLRGVGTFEDVSDIASTELSKTVTIYGENGRGKSTFASVIRAAATGDSDAIAARRTFLSNREPEIHLRWSGENVRYTGDAWQAQPIGETLIFDATFINKNVFVGDRVEPTQRERLLEFALGVRGVSLKGRIDELTVEIADLTRQIGSAREELAPISASIPLEDFLQADPPSTLESEIEACTTQLSQALHADQIRARPRPVPVPVPSWNSGLRNVLSASVDDIDQAATELVQARIARYGTNAESWLKQGIGLQVDNECPLCSQEISTVSEVFAAYRGYFSEGYENLLRSIEAKRVEIGRALGLNVREQLVLALQAADTAIQSWGHDVHVGNVEVPSLEMARTVLDRYASACEFALAAKKSSPLQPASIDAELEEAEAEFRGFVTTLQQFNARLAQIGATIEAFLLSLGARGLSEIQSELARLEALGRKRDATVNDLCSLYNRLQTTKAQKVREKASLRDQLEEYAQETLNTYADSINSLLSEFGATARIEGLQPTFRSGTPRTEYVLSVGSRPVTLSSEGNVDAEFSHALSEGDKRSLALAFFLAKATESESIGTTVVVIDDPMNSLDMHRRRKTISHLKRLSSMCGQMVLLSHDAYFVRDFQREFGDQELTSLSMQRRGVGSAITHVDIEAECLEEHVRVYKTLCEFQYGSYTGTLDGVTQAIRKYLEHCLRSRFPIELIHRNTLGKMVQAIRECPANSPLQSAKASLAILSDTNDFTSPYAHLGEPSAPLMDPEVLRYVESALTFGRG